MYPSGRWDGFWQQAGFGRQPMEAFTLTFRRGQVTGSGTDLIGPFTIMGQYDSKNGIISFVKVYIGKHRVQYDGKPDGEGCIMGTWLIDGDYATYKGPFLLRPVVERSASMDHIGEIRPRG